MQIRVGSVAIITIEDSSITITVTTDVMATIGNPLIIPCFHNKSFLSKMVNDS